MSEFKYEAKLTGLRAFHVSMKDREIDIGTFLFHYNGVESDVILDTLSRPWKLVFIKRGNGGVFTAEIKPGYVFCIESDQSYREFIAYYNIGGGRGEFSIKEFKELLNGSIPDKYVLTDETRESVMRYNRLDNDQEGIYPIGIINWQLQHAKHQEWPKDKYHRSDENLIKTKQLYPELFKETKAYDITIRYGITPGEKTKSLKDGNYDWKQEE